MEKRISSRTKYFLDGIPAVWIAQKNGISINTFKHRIHEGWTVEKACTYTHKRIKLISIETGLPEWKIYYLRRKKGYTYQQIEEMYNGKIL